MPGAIDLHQHLWPELLVEALRRRDRAPYLRGWTVYVDGEPPYRAAPADHDIESRLATDRAAGVDLTCVSLSSPLGIEELPPEEAGPLLDAWHEGAGDLPEGLRAWASVSSVAPDPDGLRARLAEGFVGVQLPATLLTTPEGWLAAGPVLVAAEAADRPVLVHPGAAPSDASAAGRPAWWAAVVDYSAQLQAAWWAWHAVGGRAHFPALRVVFAAGAGLAPLHQERHTARGGGSGVVDPDLFVDTSSYGPRAIDALVRVLGIDAVVLGSDRPYASWREPQLGEAAVERIRHQNPERLLGRQVGHGRRGVAA